MKYEALLQILIQNTLQSDCDITFLDEPKLRNSLQNNFFQNF